MQRSTLSGLAMAVVLGWTSLAAAALCPKCSDLMFVDSPGKCSVCGAETASGALKLCPKCSAARHQCEHCLGKLDDQAASSDKSPPEQTPPADKPPAPAPAADTPSPNTPASNTPPADAATTGSKPLVWKPAGETPSSETPTIETPPPAKPAGSPPAAQLPADVNQPIEDLPKAKTPTAPLPPDANGPPPAKIDPTRPGTFSYGKWQYRLDITDAGTRSEGRWGWLWYNGQKLPRGHVNDYYRTPWGPIFWVDVPQTRWGMHGWMPKSFVMRSRPTPLLVEAV